MMNMPIPNAITKALIVKYRNSYSNEWANIICYDF